MHFWMTVMFSGLLGLMIFLLAAMDNPFRGQISVGPEAFEMVYEQLMKPGKRFRNIISPRLFGRTGVRDGF